MKKTSYARSLMLCGSISLAMSACGGGNSEATTPESTASTSASTSSAAAVTSAAPTASAVASSAPAPEPGADIKVVPMKIGFDANSPTVELKADGTVWAAKGGKNVKIGAFAKNAFTTD